MGPLPCNLQPWIWRRRKPISAIAELTQQVCIWFSGLEGCFGINAISKLCASVRHTAILGLCQRHEPSLRILNLFRSKHSVEHHGPGPKEIIDPNALEYCCTTGSWSSCHDNTDNRQKTSTHTPINCVDTTARHLWIFPLLYCWTFCPCKQQKVRDQPTISLNYCSILCSTFWHQIGKER